MPDQRQTLGGNLLIEKWARQSQGREDSTLPDSGHTSCGNWLIEREDWPTLECKTSGNCFSEGEPVADQGQTSCGNSLIVEEPSSGREYTSSGNSRIKEGLPLARKGKIPGNYLIERRNQW